MKTILARLVPNAPRIPKVLGSVAVPILVALALLSGQNAARAASSPPERMTYQGFLVDNNGNPLAPSAPVNYPILFRIYDASEGGNLLWAEQQIVTVDKGSFSVVLGEGTDVAGEPRNALSSVFLGNTASDRYLGITVTIGGNSLTIQPRLRLLPSPYSFLASQAVQLINPSSGAPFVSLNAGEATIPSNARFGNEVFWGTGAYLRNDQGGSLELGNSMAANQSPYIDFHYGKNSFQDYNIRLINDGDGRLSLLGGRLSFGSTQGNSKLVLWDNGLGGGIGLGIGNAQFRLHLNQTADRFSFLNGPSGTEVFTIKGNGAVGIGTANPKATLHNTGDYYGPGHLWLHAYEGDGNSGTAFVQARDLSGTSSLNLQFRTQKSGGLRDVMRLTPDGRVGIGLWNPRAPLEVSGWAVVNANFSYYARNSAGAVYTGSAGGNVDYSILAERRIGASEFNAFSDARIKEVVGLSDSQKDLELIQKLRVTDYHAVDKIADGDSLKKGFIAQEVRALIPEAVSTNSGFVPDIYALPTAFDYDAVAKRLTVTIPKAHQLKEGDRVRVLADDTKWDLLVEKILSPEQFVLGECERKPAQMFVYGKEVPDFHTLNYDRIFTTGISAIQELSRMVQSKDSRIEALEREIASLKKQAATHADISAQWEARFAALEKMVAASQAADRNSGHAEVAVRQTR